MPLVPMMVGWCVEGTQVVNDCVAASPLLFWLLSCRCYTEYLPQYVRQHGAKTRHIHSPV